MKNYLSKVIGNISHEELRSMIYGMKYYRDYVDGIDDRYSLSFQVEVTGNGFTITYTWCLGIVPGRGDEPAFNTDPEYVTDSGRIFLTQFETHRKLSKEIDDVFDEVTKEPFDEEMDYK